MTPAAGRLRLDVTGALVAGLHVTARNAGDEPAEDVVPTVLFQHRTWTGEAARLEPGGTHEWQFGLPTPASEGTVPAIVRVRYRDGLGRTGAVPLVLAVPTPGAEESPIRAKLETSPVAGSGHGELQLENPTDRAVAGRVVFVLPGNLTTEPESIPAQMSAGGGRALVPVVVQASGVPAPGSYPIFAVFEHSQDAVQYTTVARATIAVVGSEVAGRNRRLAVGLTALLASLMILAFAWRATRRR